MNWTLHPQQSWWVNTIILHLNMTVLPTNARTRTPVKTFKTARRNNNSRVFKTSIKIFPPKCELVAFLNRRTQDFFKGKRTGQKKRSGSCPLKRFFSFQQGVCLSALCATTVHRSRVLRSQWKLVNFWLHKKCWNKNTQQNTNKFGHKLGG